MENPNLYLDIEMQNLEEQLKQELEYLFKLKEDFKKGLVTEKEVFEAVKKTNRTSTQYEILLNDIIERLENIERRKVLD